MIPYLAQLYVNVLEPAFTILCFVIALAFVIYIFNLLRGAGDKNGFITNVVNFVVKTFVKTIQLTGVGVLKSLKVLLTTTSLIFATVRDFLTSKI